jgi:hypothetical protein
LNFDKLSLLHIATDIVDMAIPQVVCQKSDFHGNSDFQNYQLQITAKKFQVKIRQLSSEVKACHLSRGPYKIHFCHFHDVLRSCKVDAGFQYI